MPGPSKYPQIGVDGPKFRVFRVYSRVDGGCSMGLTFFFSALGCRDSSKTLHGLGFRV